MEAVVSDKKLVVQLLMHKPVLEQLLSFSEPVARCNFTTTQSTWTGKRYVSEHGVDEYKPTMRGVEVLDTYYLKMTDYVVLTEEQSKDYAAVLALYKARQ